MDRNHFLKKSLLGLGAMAVLPMAVSSCSKGREGNNSDMIDTGNAGDCALSPAETQGPFPIRTPAEYVRASIIGDRTGIPLLMNLTIQDQSNSCTPLANVLVDVWQCDKDGLYSQYNTQTGANYLRGRQTTDNNGQVSFISIFPGWYRGRAPHIHVEVLTPGGNSLLVTQIAFPVSAYTAVYATNDYNGAPDTSNTQDSIFADSLSRNMADSITGNITDGYTLTKRIVVA
ncbi:hypothetical protein LJ707_10980 [Mucilaginibacter sp. UR6-1]|uniref:dioxygenase family protein n=1 Tax=Mucilaginibacter sp. UR6-1 TaxID=1435643 RepID=UPI001E53DCF1|nr:hypothetical protein [Mucilaginibacter sp. UR6-1]MCC8409456.1 hypothetical protein [Mucilaginibacter sp. UR6-1]